MSEPPKPPPLQSSAKSERMGALMSRELQEQIGSGLRVSYDDSGDQHIPDRLRKLIEQLDAGAPAAPPGDAAARDQPPVPPASPKPSE